MAMNKATTAQIKAAIDSALRTEHCRTAHGWDKGGIALELARDTLAKQDLTMPNAQFDDETIDIAGITIDLIDLI